MLCYTILSCSAFNSAYVANIFVSNFVANVFILSSKLDSLIKFFCAIFASSVLLVNVS